MPLYPILDTGHLHGHPLEDVVSAAIDGGADWIQIRHKGDFTRDFVSTLEVCAKRKRDLILNDRADYAALFGLGLHVGQTDLPPSEARAIIGPNARLGLSTHSHAQLAAAQDEPVDYLAIGPIYSTSSKLNPDPVVGLETFHSRHPLVAIGGITLDNAGPVLQLGVEKVAVISALWQPPYTLKSFRDNIQRWLHQLSSYKA
ncbi:MAG: thiamine phosphate synthase [Chloroflexia bacterium]